MLLDCLCPWHSSSKALPNFEIINGPKVCRPLLKRMEPYDQCMSVGGLPTSVQILSHKSIKRPLSSNSTLAVPTSAWARFPSHTRAERCFSPAGRADQVESHDFIIDFPSATVTEGSRKRRISRYKGANRSQNRRRRGPIRSVLDGISRCYTVGFRGFEKGHRSSISSGGVLEYPELELLPSIELFPPSQHVSRPVYEATELPRVDRTPSIFCYAASPFEHAVSSLKHASSSRSLQAGRPNESMRLSESISDESVRTIVKSARPRIKSSSYLSSSVAQSAVDSISRLSV